jgi:hypothetical protein
MITTSQLGYSSRRDARSRKKFQTPRNFELKRRLFRGYFLEGKRVEGMHLFGGEEFMVMGHEATICLLPPVLIFVHLIQLSIIDEFEFDGTFSQLYNIPFHILGDYLLVLI